MPHVDPPEEYRFKPGQSGNPAGRPKGAFSVSDALVKILNNQIRVKKNVLLGTKKSTFIPVGTHLALSMVAKALRGSEKAAEFVSDRVEGKVPQPIKHSGLPPTTINTNIDLTGLTKENLNELLNALEAKKQHGPSGKS